MHLTTILKKLEHYLISQHSIAGTQLQEGISKAEVKAKLGALPLVFPPEVFHLYEWKNGMKDSSRERVKNSLIFPWGIFKSFDRCLSIYNIAIKERYWERKYFPLFASGDGDYILINCDPDDILFGYLYLHSMPLYGDDLEGMYASLDTLLLCVLECFESGAYYFVNGAFKEDYQLADPIVAKYELADE